MKNKNLILLLAAGAAYWYFFIYLKNKNSQLPVTSPGFPSLPGQPGQPPAPVQTAPAIKPESVTITDEIMDFTAPERKLEYEQDGVYQTYYVNQVSGVKRVGVPYTI